VNRRRTRPSAVQRKCSCFHCGLWHLYGGRNRLRRLHSSFNSCSEKDYYGLVTLHFRSRVPRNAALHIVQNNTSHPLPPPPAPSPRKNTVTSGWLGVVRGWTSGPEKTTRALLTAETRHVLLTW